MRACATFLFCAITWAMPSGLLAQEQPAPDAQWLAWQVPDDCPTSEVVQARVERLLAHGAGRPAKFRAKARVSKRSRRFVMELELSLHGRTVKRSLNAADCASVSDAAAWLIALAADPALPPDAADTLAEPEPVTAVSAAQPTEPAATAEPAPPPPAAAQPATPPVAATRPASPPQEHGFEPWRVRAGGFAGVLQLGLAGVAPSVGARAGVEHGSLILDASVAFQLARTRPLEPRGSASFSSQEFALNACYAWGAVMRVGVCGHAALLWVHGHADGIESPADASGWSGRAGLSLLGTWHVAAPLELWLEPRISGPVSARPEFDVEGRGAVAEGSWLVWALYSGVAAVFP